jgi:subtilisin
LNPQSSTLLKRVSALLLMLSLLALVSGIGLAEEVTPEVEPDAPTATFTATATQTPVPPTATVETPTAAIEAPTDEPTATVETPTDEPTAEQITPTEPEPEITAEVEPEMTEIVIPDATPTPTDEPTPTTTGEFVLGRSVIVHMRMDYVPEPQLRGRPDAIQQQRGRIQTEQQRLVDRLSAAGINHHGARSLQTMPYMAVTVDEEGLAALQNDPNVLGIYNNDPQPLLTQYANELVGASGAEGAWALGYDGTGYAVAVLDTGVDFTHPALAGKNVHEACFSYDTNGVPVQLAPGIESPAVSACPAEATIDPNTGDVTMIGPGAAQPATCNGCDHGTHVAGIAAGDTSNFKGVAPGADVIGVNVFTIFTDTTACSNLAGTSPPCTMTFPFDQMRGLEEVYKVRNDFNIASVNLSLGGGGFGSACDSAEPGYADLVNSLRNAGIAVVAAAGNGGFTNAISRPACYSGAVSVGSTTVSNDTVSSFSNSAGILDLLAPGQSINSSVPGGGYVTYAGTSMAAPYVAGAWAIMRQMFPGDSVTQTLARLQDTGKPITDSRNGLIRSRIQLNNLFVTPRNQESLVFSSQSFSLRHFGGPVTWYQLWIGEGSTKLFDQWYKTADICNDTDCTITPDFNLAGGKTGSRDLNWWFRTYRSDGSYGIWHGPFDFQLIAPQVSPPTNTTAIDGRVTFHAVQQSEDGVVPTWYNVYVNRASNNALVFSRWVEIDPTGDCNGVCTLVPDYPLLNGDYRYWVRAYTPERGYTTWSQPQTFNVSASAPLPSSIVLNGIYNTSNPGDPCEGNPGVCTARRPAFQVQYDQDGLTGTWIRMRIQQGSTTAFIQWYEIGVSDECPAGTGTCTFVPTSNLAPGSYTVSFLPYGAAGSGVYGTPTSFIIDSANKYQGQMNTEYLIGNGYVRFYWEHNEPTYTWYELYISRSSDGQIVHRKWYTVEELGCAEELEGLTVSCIVSPPVDFRNQNYDWWIRGWNGVNGLWSDKQVFPDLLTAVMPLTPGLNEPAPNATLIESRPEFKWDRVNHASYYQLEIRQGSTTLHSQWYRSLDVCSATVCVVPSPRDLTSGEHRWRVRAWGPAGYGEWTASNWNAARVFTMSGDTVGLPGLQSPAVDAALTTNAPVFTWTPGANASWYQLYVSRVGGTVQHNQWYYLPNCGGECVVDPGLSLSNGNYQWWVRSYGPGGYSGWAPSPNTGSPFTIAVPPSVAPTLVSPANGAALGGSMTFTWNTVDHATWYQVIIRRTNGTTAFSRWYTLEQLGCEFGAGHQCSVTLPASTVGSGAYDWTIASYSQGSTTPYPQAATRRFYKP